MIRPAVRPRLSRSIFLPLLVSAALLGGQAQAAVASAGRLPCIVNPAASITVADLHALTGSSFTPYISLKFTVFPIKCRAGTCNQPVSTQFVAGRMTGLLISISLHGKYKQENDAFVRKLHGVPGKWPLVPLFGSIVRDHPGTLEVYEQAWVWKSTTASKQYMTMGRANARLVKNASFFRVGVGSDSFGVVEPPPASGNQPKPYERNAIVNARFGARAITVRVQGGAGTDSDAALETFGAAMAHLALNCKI